MRISDWSSDVCSSDLSIGIQDEFRHQHIDESAINRAPAFCFSATNSFVPGLVKAQSVPFLERVIELFVGVAKRIARICRCCRDGQGYVVEQTFEHEAGFVFAHVSDAVYGPDTQFTEGKGDGHPDPAFVPNFTTRLRV